MSIQERIDFGITANPLSPREISAFAAQITLILKSGITIREGVAIMSEDAHDTRMKEILSIIAEELEFGKPLYSAITTTKVFPKYLIDMMEIGELSGRLEDVLSSLANYYEREECIVRSIKNAVTYPIIMIIMILIVIIILIVKVLPVFNQVFEQLGGEMSGFAKSMMHFGTALASNSVFIAGGCLLLLLALKVAKNSKNWKQNYSHFISTFFLTKKLNAKVASARFASAMSLMLSSGLDTDQSIDMVYKLVDNHFIRGKIDTCRMLIKQGSSFSDALAKTDIFTGVYSRMVTVGFKTGTVDLVMHKLAEQYEEEVDIQLGSLISMIEPTLVTALSIIVGMILLSVMLPLIGVMSSIS